MSKLINVYCDESCHLPNDKQKSMVLGATYCFNTDRERITDRIRYIKAKHGLPKLFEVKWTKISPAKIDFYLELIDYFFNECPVKFRAVLIPDKSILDHIKFDQTHDDWYYKMYYVMLKWLVISSNKYEFYIDIKDTNGHIKTKKLKEYLAYNIYDFNYECVTKVQQVRSNESDLLQLADLLIGAISHASRSLNGSIAKKKIIDQLQIHLKKQSLVEPSPFGYMKFNLFVWQAS